MKRNYSSILILLVGFQKNKELISAIPSSLQMNKFSYFCSLLNL